MEKMRKQATVEREKNVRFELVIRVKILYIFFRFWLGHSYVYLLCYFREKEYYMK